uniref:Protein kinase domain-containing protein n=1 Tax=Solanum lycopersicum TaxID=4081 RepID=A0A3Q7HZ92_SOLLC
MGWNCFGVVQSYKNNRKTQVQEFTTNNVRLFSYNSLRSATGHFHPSNKIGGGGFGVVYKGVLRDGTCIAIKCLSAESKQGTKEFLTEINMISNTQHPNLVQLIGCCVESGNRMLIYEYLKNNSLASALLGSNGKRVALNWPQRVAICLGTASGLAFLHEEASPTIVHRDIKASNILIDENLHPKIGDFGLAKLFPENVTHLSTRVAGTIGYLAPEYVLFGQLTKKADVYSFGVVLEIISGRRSSKSAFGVDLLVLVEWVGLYFQIYDIEDSLVISILKVWKLREEGRVLEIIDPELTEYPETELLRFIKVALFCIQSAPNQRPNMKQVIEMLSKEVNLNEKLLTEPGVYRPHSGSLQKSSSAGKNGVQSVNPFVTSTKFESFQNVTQMLPR